MFNTISDKYDFMNNVMSFGMHNYIKYLSVKNLDIKPHESILDICTGTGDLARYMKKIQPLASITGIDFSEKMLDIARKKSPNIKFVQGDVTELPFEDNTFDFVTMGFGLRNIANAEKAVNEAYRVTKPSGYFLHLDFGEKNFLSKIFDFSTPIMIKLFYKNTIPYSYLIKSKNIFPTPKELIKDFESKGFKLKARKDYLLDVISCQILKK